MKLEIRLQRVFGKEYDDDYSLENEIEVDESEVDFNDEEKMFKLLIEHSDFFDREKLEDMDDIYKTPTSIEFGQHWCGDWDDPNYVSMEIRVAPEKMTLWWATCKDTGKLFKSRRASVWTQRNHLTLALGGKKVAEEYYNYHTMTVEVGEHIERK